MKLVHEVTLKLNTEELIINVYKLEIVKHFK